MKIITIFDRNEDFIEMQYKSIVKHVKGNYEYIVFNNAKTQKQAEKIKACCDALKIKSVRIKVLFSWLKTPSQIAGIALNKAHRHIADIEGPFFKIDSDMFFVADVNLEQLFEINDLVYVPTYVPIKTVWSGLFGVNLKKVKFDFDYRPGLVPNTDTFGKSYYLIKDNKYSEKLLGMYNLIDVKDGIIETNLNGCCLMKFDKNGIIFKENDNFKNVNTLDLKNKYENIIEIMEKYNFPKPYNLDFMTLDDQNFVLHFKSSNWCPWYTEEYVNSKKEAIKRLLKDSPSSN